MIVPRSAREAANCCLNGVLMQPTTQGLIWLLLFIIMCTVAVEGQETEYSLMILLFYIIFTLPCLRWLCLYTSHYQYNRRNAGRVEPEPTLYQATAQKKKRALGAVPTGLLGRDRLPGAVPRPRAGLPRGARPQQRPRRGAKPGPEGRPRRAPPAASGRGPRLPVAAPAHGEVAHRRGGVPGLLGPDRPRPRAGPEAEGPHDRFHRER